MSEYSQRGGLTLTWRIENFSYSRARFRLKTPLFNAYSKEWCLIIDGINYITLMHYLPNENFEYLYSILDSEGAPLTWTPRDSPKSIDLVKLDEVLGPRKTTFLPNNTLTIQCRILKKGEAFSTPLSLNVRTRIQSKTCFEKWEILEFCSLAPSRQMTKTFAPMTQYDTKLNVSFVLDDEERCKFNVELAKGTKYEGDAFAACKVEALDATGKKVIFAENEHYFKNLYKPWQFTSYITKSMLMCDKNLFLPNGTLTLMFELTLSSGVEYSRMEDSPTTPTNQVTDSAGPSSSSTPSKTVDKYLYGNTKGPCNTLSRDLLNLYETGILSDCNLQIGDVTFPVHKQVLCARSPKFAAMFTAARKRKRGESEIKGIRIEDTDAATLRRMVRFMYTDTVPEDLDWKEISKLYVAADKYKLKSLRDRCAAFLKSEVCISNVCEILLLADSHQDVDLKSTILDFIMQNHMQVIETEQWNTLEKENAQLTSKIFRTLYLKKMEKE